MQGDVGAQGGGDPRQPVERVVSVVRDLRARGVGDAGEFADQAAGVAQRQRRGDEDAAATGDTVRGWQGDGLGAWLLFGC